MSKKKAIIVEILRVLFIILFAYTAITKIHDHARLADLIGKSPLLTDYAGILAWLIPISELAVVGMLAVPRLMQLGFYAFFTMMVIFTAYIAAMLQFSEELPCSCGGVLNTLGWTDHLIFNISFVLMGLAAIFLNTPGKPKASGPPQAKPDGKAQEPAIA